MKSLTIQENIDLLPYNTFKFSCIARYFVEIESLSALEALIAHPLFQQTANRLILGGGSNILLASDQFDGIVIKNTIESKEIVHETDTKTTIRVGGGVVWDRFVDRTIEHGLYGIENLTAIPGSVGAAPMQNIGAYGVEVGTVIDSVTYYDLTDGTIHALTKEECQFGYRDSIFKQSLRNKAVITHVTFTLGKYSTDSYKPTLSYDAVRDTLTKQGVPETDTPTPQQVAHAIKTIRASKLPDRTIIGTAGSFFKNPTLPIEQATPLSAQHPELKKFPTDNPDFLKFSAGQLIDLAGCKGIKQGGVGTYGDHALVLIHTGGSRGTDLLALAKKIQTVVYEKFGVTLEFEVNLIK